MMSTEDAKGHSTCVRLLEDRDRAWAAALLEARWGSVRIVSRGRVHQAGSLPALVAWRGDQRVGLLTYRREGLSCEIVSLDSLCEGVGVGTALIEAIKTEAMAWACDRLWLVTTNDNVKAITFYQHRGFELVAIHTDAINRAREIKPEIPLLGADGIPIRDEIEFEMRPHPRNA